MQQTSEALRGWFRHAEPMRTELFNAAYAMCGNYDLAEQALCAALVELWLLDATPGMGFRERARSVLRDEAFDIMGSPQAKGAEFTWPGLPEDKGENAAMRQVRQEKPELQRLILLRYGCGLSVRNLAELTGASPQRLRTALERFETRCRRKLAGGERGRTEALIRAGCQQALTRPQPGAPDATRLYRAFEAEASQAEAVGHRLPRVLGRVALTAMALLCAALFWLFAVLVQPEQLPDTLQPAATASVEIFETEG